MLELDVSGCCRGTTILTIGGLWRDPLCTSNFDVPNVAVPALGCFRIICQRKTDEIAAFLFLLIGVVLIITRHHDFQLNIYYSSPMFRGLTWTQPPKEEASVA